MKTSFFTFSSSLGVFAALVLLALPASADTESFSFSLSPTNLSTSTLNDLFTLNAFNPSLGTLTGVTLSLDLTTTASPQIYNNSGTSQAYTNTTTSFYTTLTGPDSTAVVYQANSTTDAGTVTGSTTTLTGTPVISSTSAPVVPGNFSTYEGTSPLSFSVIAPGTTQFTSAGTETSGAGTLFFGGTGTVGGSATVEYTFSAVPEPSAWALGGLCVGLFAFLRFRMRGSLN